MNRQDEPFSDELISAYLDGELSPADKVRVERILDTDPSYQQMLDELRALREGLKSLPQLQLDDGFHRRVLQRAIQENAQIAPKPASGPRHPTNDSRPGVAKRLVWIPVLAALAASLLVALYIPGFIRLNVTRAPEQDATIQQGARQLTELDDGLKRDEPTDLSEFGIVEELDNALADEAEHLPIDKVDKTSGNSQSARRGAGIERKSVDEALVRSVEDFATANRPDGLLGRAATRLALSEGDNVHVVHLSPPAASPGQQWFERVLARHQIRIENEPDDDQDGQTGRMRGNYRPDLAKLANLRSFGDVNREAELEMVYVEAPLTNIESTVADVTRISGNVLGITGGLLQQDQLETLKKHPDAGQYGFNESAQDMSANDVVYDLKPKGYDLYLDLDAGPQPSASGVATSASILKEQRLEKSTRARALFGESPSPTPSDTLAAPVSDTEAGETDKHYFARRFKSLREPEQRRFAAVDQQDSELNRAQRQQAETGAIAGGVRLDSKAESAASTGNVELLRVLFVLHPAAKQTSSADAAAEQVEETQP